MQNRAGLRQFLDSFGGTEQQAVLSNSISTGLSQEPSLGLVANEKHDTKPKIEVKLSHLASGVDSSSIQTTETRLADLLDSTLWNRRLAPSSERIVYALVQQIFNGIREYFLASAELKVSPCSFSNLKFSIQEFYLVFGGVSICSMMIIYRNITGYACNCNFTTTRKERSKVVHNLSFLFFIVCL